MFPRYISHVFFHLTGKPAEGADKDYLRSTIVDYFSDNRHESVNSTNKQRVRNFIQTEFKSFGLETVVVNFTGIASQPVS